MNNIEFNTINDIRVRKEAIKGLIKIKINPIISPIEDKPKNVNTKS